MNQNLCSYEAFKKHWKNIFSVFVFQMVSTREEKKKKKRCKIIEVYKPTSTAISSLILESHCLIIGEKIDSLIFRGLVVYHD